MILIMLGIVFIAVAIGLAVVQANPGSIELTSDSAAMSQLLVAFVTGLTTGGLSCLAVQGGLLLIATSLPDGTRGPVVAALVASGAALTIAACFLLPVGVVNNEGGVAVPVSRREAGYWLWLTSMFAAFASAALLLVQNPSLKTS